MQSREPFNRVTKRAPPRKPAGSAGQRCAYPKLRSRGRALPSADGGAMRKVHVYMHHRVTITNVRLWSQNGASLDAPFHHEHQKFACGRKMVHLKMHPKARSAFPNNQTRGCMPRLSMLGPDIRLSYGASSRSVKSPHSFPSQFTKSGRSSASASAYAGIQRKLA
jgi:hypothetical protein